MIRTAVFSTELAGMPSSKTISATAAIVLALLLTLVGGV